MTDRGYNANATNAYDTEIEQEDAETEQAARNLGTEHGKAAASWVELSEADAEAIDKDGLFEVIDYMPGPLSGEYADDYSIHNLSDDLAVDEESDDFDDLCSTYEDAYWQAFQDEIERTVEAMRGPDPSKGPHILDDDACFAARKANGNLGAHAPECFAPRIDKDARYTVDGWPKVAVNVERFTFGGKVVVVMVGDDQEHTVDPEDLTPVAGYCIECGDTNCYGGIRSDDE